MINYLIKKGLIKILLLDILIYFFVSNSYASSTNNFHLLPLEPNKSFYQTKISKSKKNLSSTVNYIEEKFNLEFKNSKAKINNSLHQNFPTMNIKSLDFILFSNFDLNVWEPYSRFSISNLENTVINCFKTDAFIIGGDSKCKENGKDLFESNNNGFSVPSIQLKGNNYGISFGIKRNYFSWKKRRSFDVELLNTSVNFKRIYNNGFSLVSGSKNNLVTNKTSWIKTLKMQFKEASVLNDKWSWGYGLTGFYSSNPLIHNIKKNNANALLELQLSRKIQQKFIVAINFKHHMKEYVDVNSFESFKFYKIDNERDGLSEISFNFTYINRDPYKILLTRDSFRKLELDNSQIDRNYKRKNNLRISKINLKNKDKTNYNNKKNDLLVEYAINYAKQIDKNNTILFN